MDDVAEPAGHGLCGARTRAGAMCRKPSGWGTPHPGIGRCKHHGGSTPNHLRSAQMELARRECQMLGVPVEIDPASALIDELWEATGNVEFYRAQVQELERHPVPPKRKVVEGGPDDGREEWEPGKAGVYGPTYHQSGVPTGEAKPHVLVVLYNQERDRRAAVAEAMLRLNIDERRVRAAEANAEKLVRAQVAALVAMGLGDRLEEFRVAFVQSLSSSLDPERRPALMGAARAA